MAMAGGETTIGGGKRDFPSTSWNLIRSAGRDDREALQRLIYLYWKPAYCYIRAAGRRGVEDAKDLTQEFFTRLLDRRAWQRLSPDRGSFRGFLKRCLKNFMVDAARREKARRPSSTALVFRFEDVRDAAADPAANPDDLFDREWIRAVLQNSIRELEERLRQDRGANLFEVFRLYCLEGDQLVNGAEGRTYADVADRLGLRESDVRKRLARCRSELRQIVLERVREYAQDEQDAQAEYARIVKG
jgi:RNA polymerase sigma-70 factor (ECF subfamily)